MNCRELYDTWCRCADDEYRRELSGITCEQDVKDRFYRSLEFGTAGLRGILGAGTNRMNTHVVRQATQALCEYIKSENGADKGVVIAYDSRNMSREFALCAALVFCKCGIKTYLFSDLRPVPVLSFAVRYLHTVAGIVITASHNPPEYNGYKVYWSDGGQITPDRCAPISDIIARTDIFSVESMTEDEAVGSGLLHYVDTEVDEAYYAYTASLSQNVVTQVQRDAVTIVYSPLHGSGYIPVTELLSRMGYTNVHVVEEQKFPDGNFPTVKAPNPENTENFELALSLANKVSADIVLATDPDSDRLGVCVSDGRGGYRALTGNKIGSLLLYYILNSKKKNGTLPADAFAVRSIVSTPLADAICAAYGVQMRTVLTGFRYIAEQIEESERTGKGHFVFGFEESYGFLAGTSVRDKDACLSAMLMCEACCCYKSQGMTLCDVLSEIERQFGAYEERSISFGVSGQDGMAKLAAFMQSQHEKPYTEIAGEPVTGFADYKKGIYTRGDRQEKLPLPEAEVCAYDIGDTARITLRPSGTEPKLKVYVAVRTHNRTEAETETDRIARQVSELIKESLN